MFLFPGTGFGLALTPSIMVLDTYFCKKRETAIAIAVSGVGVGIFTFPVVMYKLEDAYKWTGMCWSLAAICLTIALCGLLYRPPCELGTKSPALLKMFDPSLLRCPTFACLCVSNFLWSIGISIIYTHLPSFTVSTGITMEKSCILIAVTGVASFGSRTIFTVFNHSAKLDHMSNFLCCVALTAILAALFPELFKHQAGQIGYCIMLGLHTGFWTTFCSSVASEFIGLHYVAFGKGYITLCVGLGLMGGAPLAGWIYDETESYDIIFYLAGKYLKENNILI